MSHSGRVSDWNETLTGQDTSGSQRGRKAAWTSPSVLKERKKWDKRESRRLFSGPHEKGGQLQPPPTGPAGRAQRPRDQDRAIAAASTRCRATAGGWAGTSLGAETCRGPALGRGAHTSVSFTPEAAPGIAEKSPSCSGSRRGTGNISEIEQSTLRF